MRFLLLILSCLTCAGQGLRDPLFLSLTGQNPGPAWSPPAAPGIPGQVTNSASITIVDNDVASPYPSTLEVSSVTEAVTNVTVYVYGFTHTYPNDVAIMLVGPTGESVILASGSTTATPVSGLTLGFRDGGNDYHAAMTNNEVYAPFDAASSSFPAPAPAATGTTLSKFNMKDPNGTWSLYVIDEGAGDSGLISGGWSIYLETDTNMTVAYGTPWAYYNCDITTGDTQLVDSVSSMNLTSDVGMYSQAGKINQCWTANRADLYRTDDTNFDFASGDFSMRAWFRTDGGFPTSAWVALLTRSNFWLYLTPQSNLVWGVKTDGGDLNVTNAQRFNRNTWIWIMAYCSAGNEIGLSISNATTAVLSAASPMTSETGSGIDFRFVCNTNIDGFSCRWDEIGFWRGHVLNAAERVYDYNGGSGRSKP